MRPRTELALEPRKCVVKLRVARVEPQTFSKRCARSLHLSRYILMMRCNQVSSGAIICNQRSLRLARDVLMM